MALVKKCIHEDDKDLCISYEDIDGDFACIECNGKKISIGFDQLDKLSELLNEFKKNEA